MCGIAGWIGVGDRGNERAPVLDALRHRGPDASGADHPSGDGWSATLFHTRLAINDLSPTGNQPLHNEDRTLLLVFNGEIYNSPELRKRCEQRGHRFTSSSDGEVILHLWEDEGADALRLLNGIFAIALLDVRNGELTLARDPVGVKPLFWSVGKDALWFASEVRGLEVAGAPVGEPDPVALAQFLTFLWIPDPATPLDGVHSLRPGELLSWRAGRAERRRWANVVAESATEPDVAMSAAQVEIGERVRAAVDRQLLSDVPVGIMASGGVDSSLLWWAAGQRLERAYTIDWSRQRTDEGLDEDTEAVRVLEQRLPTPVTYVPGEDVDPRALPPSGDLFADPAVDLCRLISRRAHADGMKVLLSGQGGDELFGGYRRHVLGPFAARLPVGRFGVAAAGSLARWGPNNVRTEYAHRLLLAAGRGDPLSSYLTLCSYSTPADRAEALGCTEAEVSDEVVWAEHRAAFDMTPTRWSLLRRFRAVDVAVYLPGLGLAYADRAGMQHSVEVRVPWLDLDLVRWALRLPDAALVRRGTGKWLTRELALTVLPRETVERPKRGFAAPASALSTAPDGQRAFRQGAYFSNARAVLERWLGARTAA